MEHQFTGPRYRIGIEEELMVLDGESLDLANAFDRLAGETEAGEVKPQLHESVLEIATHPFARWEQQRISPSQRYRELIADIGFVARQEVIFGLHVHVALDDPDVAIR